VFVAGVVSRRNRSSFAVKSRVYFGSRFTAIKARKKELPKSLLRTMCRQLGIDPGDLEG
jgi:hypothetical protein